MNTVSRRGIALGLVVTIITLLFLTAFVFLYLMRASGTQMKYADAHLRALTIAESAAQGLIARLLSLTEANHPD